MSNSFFINLFYCQRPPESGGKDIHTVIGRNVVFEIDLDHTGTRLGIVEHLDIYRIFGFLCLRKRHSVFPVVVWCQRISLAVRDLEVDAEYRWVGYIGSYYTIMGHRIIAAGKL